LNDRPASCITMLKTLIIATVLAQTNPFALGA